ncbi:unnamed protein product [Trifolium pratense]|uniref:Uncharacterized protein n=1 Tax=Trifolium pratense TaxID=57577 RepID=A0ACB0L5P8_TRIPR|nr:unnamed protein product [Trifolium pratense]
MTKTRMPQIKACSSIEILQKNCKRISSTTMSRSGQPPDLKKYMDKQLQIKLNANRMIVGTLREINSRNQ